MSVMGETIVGNMGTLGTVCVIFLYISNYSKIKRLPKNCNYNQSGRPKVTKIEI